MNVAWRNRTYPRVDGADDVSCRPDFSIMAYPWQSVAQPPVNGSVERASALNVTAANPPTMLVQCEDDPTAHVENSFFYYLALKQKGAAPSEMHLWVHCSNYSLASVLPIVAFYRAI
jgi:hypothetical protein